MQLTVRSDVERRTFSTRSKSRQLRHGSTRRKRELVGEIGAVPGGAAGATETRRGPRIRVNTASSPVQAQPQHQQEVFPHIPRAASETSRQARVGGRRTSTQYQRACYNVGQGNSSKTKKQSQSQSQSQSENRNNTKQEQQKENADIFFAGTAAALRRKLLGRSGRTNAPQAPVHVEAHITSLALPNVGISTVLATCVCGTTCSQTLQQSNATSCNCRHGEAISSGARPSVSGVCSGYQSSKSASPSRSSPSPSSSPGNSRAGEEHARGHLKSISTDMPPSSLGNCFERNLNFATSDDSFEVAPHRSINSVIDVRRGQNGEINRSIHVAHSDTSGAGIPVDSGNFSKPKASHLTPRLRNGCEASETERSRTSITSSGISPGHGDVGCGPEGHPPILPPPRCERPVRVSEPRSSVSVGSTQNDTDGSEYLPLDMMMGQIDEKHQRRFCRLFDLRLGTTARRSSPWSEEKSDPSWPLHVKHSKSEVDVVGILHAVRERPWSPEREEIIADLQWTCDFLSNPTNPAHVSLARARFLADMFQREIRVKRSRMSLQDLDVLIESDTARVSILNLEGPTTFAFTVGEPSKTPPRRRQICDTIISNAFGEEIEQPFISSVGQLKSIFKNNYFFSEFDFQAWYFQFRWADAVAALYTLQIGNRLVELTRMTMGHYAACKAGHSTSRGLVFLSKVEMTDSDIIIDNVMFASKSLQNLHTTNTQFTQNCARFGAVIGSFSGIKTDVIHRGILYSGDGLLSLKPGWCEKYVSRYKEFKTKSTWGRLRSLMGMLAWARAVLGAFPQSFYFLWKFIARCANKCNGLPHGDMMQLSLPPYIWRDLNSVATWIAGQPTAFLPDTDTMDSVIATDAALTFPFSSWGAVCISPSGRFMVASGQFEFATTAGIAVLEARAVQIALSYWHRHLFRRSLTVLNILIDNTAALGALQYQSSPNWALDAVCQAVTVAASRINRQPQYFYIPSAQNPADEPSRGLIVSLPKVSSILSKVQRSPCGYIEPSAKIGRFGGRARHESNIV